MCSSDLIGRDHYSMICAEDGGIVDDLIVYRLGTERFLVVPNAGNARTVSDAVAERIAGFRAVLDDRSLSTALCAVQGPRAAAILAPITDVDLTALRYYAIAEGSVAGIPALVARTGYTGEDGFEISVANDRAERLARLLLSQPEVKPAGLGARDSLRLEAGLCLYGHDIDTTTTPIEADLAWTIGRRRREHGGFPGAGAILGQLANGSKRKRIGRAHV